MEYKKWLTPENMSKALDTCYEQAIHGIPGSKDCRDLAQYYLNKYDTKERAAKALIKAQLAKCSADGFVTGFGGFAEMLVALPVNVTSVLYIQLRMIAALAVIGGYDPFNDETQTIAYLCLINETVGNFVKQFGVKTANKLAKGVLDKIPGKALIAINKKIGFRLVTKYGEKGTVNLIKLVPVAGAFAGAGIDFADTKIIADRAYKTFILNKLD